MPVWAPPPSRSSTLPAPYFLQPTRRSPARRPRPPVSAGAATQFPVPTPVTQTAGAAFNETITAQDADKNTDPTYAGGKAIVFTGPGTSPVGIGPLDPGSVTFASGVGTASITLYRAGSPALGATLAIIGISGPVRGQPRSGARHDQGCWQRPERHREPCLRHGTAGRGGRHGTFATFARTRLTLASTSRTAAISGSRTRRSRCQPARSSRRPTEGRRGGSGTRSRSRGRGCRRSSRSAPLPRSPMYPRSMPGS